jgi:serine/threonine-protein kinase
VGRSDRDIVDELEGLLDKLHETPDETDRARLRDEIHFVGQALWPLVTPRPGDVLGGRELVRRVGHGAFATVWLSKKPGSEGGEQFATKVIHGTCLSTGLMLSRFRRGVRAMHRLTQKTDRHPQIVPILVEDDSSLAFTMPFFAGETLADVKSRGWSLDKKVEVLASICAAVEYAHRNGVVHRDIKPNNILFDAQGTPVLTDFDLADIEHESNTYTEDQGPGSLMFAAPEQVPMGQPSQVTFDVYSLGRLLHYLLVEGPMSLDPTHPKDRAALRRFPRSLVVVVRRATHKNPAKRYRDVASLRAAVVGYRRPRALLAAWIHTARTWLWDSITLVSVALLVATASALVYVRLQHQRLVEDFDVLFAEYDHLHAEYRAMVGSRMSNARRREEAQREMTALADKYFEYDKKPPSPSIDKLKEDFDRKFSELRDDVIRIEAEEHALDDTIAKRIAPLDKRYKDLLEQSKRSNVTPPARPEYDWGSVPPKATAEPPPLPPLQGEPPTEFAPGAVAGRINRAKEAAIERCRGLVQGPTKVSVGLAVLPSGEVTAEMTSGPKGTPTEACVLGVFRGFRVQPPTTERTFSNERRNVFETTQSFTLREK